MTTMKRAIAQWHSGSPVQSGNSTDQEVVLRDYASGMRPGVTCPDPVFREMAVDVACLPIAPLGRVP